MIHIKFVAIICFKENRSSFKRLFWNNGPSNMVSQVVFTAFLPKTLWKNCHFLIQIFEIHFKIYYFGKFYDLKPATTYMAVFSIQHKVCKKNRIYWCFNQAFIKNVMKKLLFLLLISEAHFMVYYIANFHDLKLSATKITAVSM